MVLGITLRDVLYQGAVVRQKVRRNVNSLCVPNLTVLQAIHVGVERRQEPKLCADAEVGDNYVEGLVK